MAGRKNNGTTEVLIGGKIYRLSGSDSMHLREVAAFLNEELERVSHMQGYGRLNSEDKALLLNLNLADEYFNVLKENEKLRGENEELEKELYTLRHNVVNTRLRAEDAEKDRESAEKQTEEWRKRYEGLRRSVPSQRNN